MIKKCLYAFIFAFALTFILFNPKVYAEELTGDALVAYNKAKEQISWFNESSTALPPVFISRYSPIWNDTYYYMWFNTTNNYNTQYSNVPIGSLPTVKESNGYRVGDYLYQYISGNWYREYNTFWFSTSDTLKSTGNFVNFNNGQVYINSSLTFPSEHNYSININNAQIDYYINQLFRLTFDIYDNDEHIGYEGHLPTVSHIGWIYNNNLTITDTNFDTGLWFYATTSGVYEFTIQLLDEDDNVVASQTKNYSFINRPDTPVVPSNPIQIGFIPNGLPIQITTNIDNGNIIVDDTINFNEYKYLYMTTYGSTDTAYFSTLPLFRYKSITNDNYLTGVKDYAFPIKVKRIEFDINNNYNIRAITDFNLTTASIVNNSNYGVPISYAEQFINSNYNVFNSQVDAFNFLVKSDILVNDANLNLDYGNNTGGSDSDNTFDILGNYIKNWFVQMFVPTQEHNQIVNQFLTKIGFLDSFKSLFNDIIEVCNSDYFEPPTLNIDFTESNDSLYSQLGSLSVLDLSFISQKDSIRIKKFTSVILLITFLFFVGSNIPNILSGITQGMSLDNIRNVNHNTIKVKEPIKKADYQSLGNMAEFKGKTFTVKNK